MNGHGYLYRKHPGLIQRERERKKLLAQNAAAPPAPNFIIFWLMYFSPGPGVVNKPAGDLSRGTAFPIPHD